MIRWYNLFFIFCVCVGCFLAGWLTAVYILPGNKLYTTRHQTSKTSKTASLHLQNAEKAHSMTTISHIAKNTEQITQLSLFEEINQNIMILFDPYKIDSLWTNYTYFTKPNPNKEFSTVPSLQQINDSKQNYQILKSKSPQKGKAQPQQVLIQAPKAIETNQQTVSLAPLASPALSEQAKTLQNLQSQYDKYNKEQFLKITEEQNPFSLEGKFGFFINAFSKSDEALKYVNKMKDQYPSWSFLLKAHEKHTQIYLGPFESKEKALKFKATIPYPPFSYGFLGEVSL